MTLRGEIIVVFHVVQEHVGWCKLNFSPAPVTQENLAFLLQDETQGALNGLQLAPFVRTREPVIKPPPPPQIRHCTNVQPTGCLGLAGLPLKPTQKVGNAKMGLPFQELPWMAELYFGPPKNLWNDMVSTTASKDFVHPQHGHARTDRQAQAKLEAKDAEILRLCERLQQSMEQAAERLGDPFSGPRKKGGEGIPVGFFKPERGAKIRK